jgi:leucyl-tRNA synthetase
MAYDHRVIEAKYRQLWHEKQVYQPDLLAPTRPYYNLMMFPYPSAEGLHVGNMYAFTGADCHGRWQRMQGKDVLEPIGLDGFGIHSENYAMKVGRHPAEQAKISQHHFYEQLDAIGDGFAWDNRLETYDPAYYRWTQWLFIQMFKHGLAYKAAASVNWCPSCKTVLADEQVEDGKCERCKTTVERRDMSSWFFRITKYADRLLNNITDYQWTDRDGGQHTGLQWPAKVTTAQKNWIGRQEGLDIDFAVVGEPDMKITVWTKYWETVFGVTYLVVAPEYPGLYKLTTPRQSTEVTQYVRAAKHKSEQDRQVGAGKSGVFTGSYAVNPVNGEQVPIWIADYVLRGVGTGAVMGVPAHDERDWDFATKFELPIRQVVQYADAEMNAAVAAGERSFEGEGVLVNSEQFNGQDAWGAGKTAMKSWLIEQGWSRERVQYHLRDWLISRQRYWGPPIPMVYCASCKKAQRGEREDMPGWYSVVDAELPIELPMIDDFRPKGDGTSPLANAPRSWLYVQCPGCGGEARRETDVSDTFLDSAWYFLRYPVIHDDQQPFVNPSPWFPVDAYIGGAEHAVLHLLYARFVTMTLHDWQMLPGDEPFPFLFGHGLIIKDGAKMSKSRGNVVNPDEYVAKYGADALRCYLMFLGPYDQGGDFRDTGMHGMYKWLQKVAETLADPTRIAATSTPDLARKLHQVIAQNTQDMGQFKFNTCIARLMEVMNLWRTTEQMGQSEVKAFLQLLAPFAPYLTEELYQQWRQHNEPTTTEFASIHRSTWPTFDRAHLEQGTQIVVVQVNGKRRGEVSLSTAAAAEQTVVVENALADAAVQRAINGQTIRKTIFVPGKIVNFVIG